VPTKQQLGERIKRFRLERNLTLKDVELAAKVSATHVSEIERGMTSPTVGALTRIARALGTEPSYFLRREVYPACSVVRQSDRHALEDHAWGAKISRLSNGVSGADMSFLEFEISTGHEREIRPRTHSGETLVHVLQGLLEVRVGEDMHLLKEGDSLHFQSREPHAARNIGDGTARFLWVATPPLYL
jgi:transcriptional regulator with XRE-family HTH domain